MPSPTAVPSQAPTLHRLQDLADASRTTRLAQADLAALRSVAEWVTSFVARPHKDLGRDGPVCPFVPTALEQQTLWLAAEHVAGRSAADVIELVKACRMRFLQAEPVAGDDATYKSLVVVFADLPADRAKALFDEVLAQLAV